jgi:hypothetical protein
MSAPPLKTTFTPRGRLNGVLRHRSSHEQGERHRRDRPTPTSAGGTADLDTPAYEALNYRARLILGDALPRPARS